MKPDQDRLRAVFNQRERRIEDRWGIPVHIQDVPIPLVTPLEIPELQPTQWLSRYQGTVV